MLKAVPVQMAAEMRACGGMPVNDVRARFLGPLFDEELVRVDDAAIHLLDGTHLGRLRDIRVDLGFRPEDYRQ